MVSTTVTVVEQDAEEFAESVATISRSLVPSGNSAVNTTFVGAGGWLAGTWLVCTGIPFNDQTAVSASPSGSLICTGTTAGVPALHPCWQQGR